MHRWLMIASRVAIGLLLLFLCITGLTLVPQAPRFAQGNLAWVAIHSGNDGARISRRQLDCTWDADRGRCTIELEGQLLEMVIDGTTSVAKPLVNQTTYCQAIYAGRSLACYGFKHYPSPHNMMALSIHDDLGLSRQTLEQLRRENRFVRFGESSWLRFTTYFAAISGAAAALAVWGHLRWLNRIFVGISHGLAGIAIALGIASPLRFVFLTLFHLPLSWLLKSWLLNLPGWMAVGIGFTVAGVAIWSMRRLGARVLSGISFGLIVYVASFCLLAIGLSALGYL